jgi:protease I
MIRLIVDGVGNLRLRKRRMRRKIFYILAVIFLSLGLGGCVKKEELSVVEAPKMVEEGGEEKVPDLSGKKVLMVIAPSNFRDEEFAEPKNVLGSLGVEVTVTSKGVKEAQGAMGTKVKIDKDLNEVGVTDYEGIIFVGGPGTTVYFNDSQVLGLAKEAVLKDKVVGAICIAPTILAKAGVVSGKRMTAFASEEQNLVKAGAEFTGASVEVDGKLVTADGPGSARNFGERMAEVLGRD